jgi:elongation factor G
MKGIPVAGVRNFSILGHPGSGKTTLADAILYKIGINDRRGDVDAGFSMSDFTDEEKNHKNSIYATPCPMRSRSCWSRS